MIGWNSLLLNNRLIDCYSCRNHQSCESFLSESLKNTPKKIVNNEYFKLENKPIEISLRNTLARSFEISEIPEIIKEILSQKNLQENKDSNNEIDKIIKSNFY